MDEDSCYLICTFESTNSYLINAKIPIENQEQYSIIEKTKNIRMLLLDEEIMCFIDALSFSLPLSYVQVLKPKDKAKKENINLAYQHPKDLAKDIRLRKISRDILVTKDDYEEIRESKHCLSILSEHLTFLWKKFEIKKRQECPA